MLVKLDFHPLPISQFCIISANAVAEDKHQELFSLLEIQMPKKRTDTFGEQRGLSRHQFSSEAIMRLTKRKDIEVFKWLESKVGLHH